MTTCSVPRDIMRELDRRASEDASECVADQLDRIIVREAFAHDDRPLADVAHDVRNDYFEGC